MRARRIAVVLAALLSTSVPTTLVARAVHAQDKPAPVMIAPKLKKFVEPIYPPERLAKGEKANVVVALTIDATGKVLDAKIVESAGEDFDAAAIEAAKQLEFEPATIDGKPSPAKIGKFRFSFDFKETPKETPTTAAPKPSVDFTGVVRGPDEQPIAGAQIVVVAADGQQAQTTTDAGGRFTFVDLPDGAYHVVVTLSGFAPFEQNESIKRGVITDVVYRPSLAGGAEITIVGEKPPREVVKRELSREEIQRVPGTNGDVIRSIQLLPGVNRSPGLFGFVLVRGAAPQDTNYFVDGTIVPIIFHFGGLSSVIPAEMVDHFDFFPGNFGPEYGRVMGGIIDVGLKSPRKDRWGGLLQIDLLDARTVVEGPIDSKTRVAVAARRSWVDLWLKPVLQKAGTGVSTAPVYYDYQLVLERDLSDKTTGRLSFYGSDDRLAITLNSPNAGDPAFGGDISNHTGFLRGEALVETHAAKNVTWRNVFSAGFDRLEFDVGDYFFHLVDVPILLRSDVRAKISKEASLIVGLDGFYAYYDVSLRFPPLPPPGEAPGPFFARPAPELRGTGGFFRPAAYAMLDLSPVSALHLLPAIRFDYSKDTDLVDVSPRFIARYDLVPEFPKTTLKGAVGIYQQPPQPNQSIPPFGTPGLKDQRATHYDIGFEQEFTRQVNVTLDGWYKTLQDLVTVQPTSSSANGLTYGNTGSGRIYGLDMWLRYKPDERFFGWISYTLSRSERRDFPNYPIRLAAFDQTHILAVVGSYKLGRGWQVGATFRYVTGALYTPNLGGVSDFDAGAYQPIPSFPQYTARLPAFHELDLRVDKDWKFTDWTLGVYLDLHNVYNRQNPEALQYNYNYSQSNIVSFLPFLPILGVRGQI